VYLAYCYLATGEGEIDIKRMNEIIDSYIEKHGISKTDAIRREKELSSLFFISIFNNSAENYEDMVYYLLLAKDNLNKRWENKTDKLSTELFKLLSRGYYYLEDFKSSIEYGLVALELNTSFWGEKNIYLLEVLEILYSSYRSVNELEIALEFLLKEVDVGKEILGEQHPNYLISLINLTSLYTDLGDFKSALAIDQQVVDLRKEVLGEKHPDYLTSLNNLAFSYSELGEYNSALEINKEVSKLGKEVWGEKHPNYLTTLSNLALSYSDLGDYKLALQINQDVAELRKNILGEKHPDYLTSLINLALSYSKLGDYHSALDINQQVLELGKEVWEEKHPGNLTNLNNLAQSYSYLGNYYTSIEINKKVVDLWKEAFGVKNPDYLISLINLAKSYLYLGDYQSALDINQQALELGKEVWGEKHPNYLTNLSNLAQSYLNLGNYYSALEINQKVVDLRKEALGENHPDYLVSLIGLAASYSNLGDYHSALDINRQVLEIGKKVWGEKHPNFLMNLGNLAQSYSNLGNYYMAIELEHQVTDLRKEVSGENHPDYLRSLNNLAASYSYNGDYQSSLEINLNVVELRKEVLGEMHPDFLVSLNNLATNFSDLGDFQSALENYQQVEELRKKVSGLKHPDYTLSLSNLAISEFNLDKIDLALNHIVQSLNLRRERAIEYFRQLTERQRENFWAQSSYSFELFPLFLEKSATPSHEEVNFAYDIALFTKGLLLNTTVDFDQLLAENGNPEAIEKYKDLKLLKVQIQRLYEKPIAERYLNVDSLETVAQKLETELVNLSKEYGDYTQNLKITWKDVQSNLGDKDVAIEFLEYPTFTDTVKYAALVLRKGWTNPKFIPLFRKDQIEEFLNRDPNQIYSNGFVGKEIKKLVWNPLEEFIAPGDNVHFSAAGFLHQLAIENLSSSDSTTLGDRYQMYRLSSTKELALQKPESKTQSVALYGGIKYDLELNQMITESEKYRQKDAFYALRGIAQDSTLRKGWQFLPGTLTETHEISEVLNENQYQVGEFLGETGSEESFKALSGKGTGIIHIATHGFFLPVEQSKRNTFIQMRFDGQSENIGYVDPMLRCGLLLAGGNRAWQGDSIPDTIEDGILTAKEISHVDLRETDLVVLSACETGLGDVSSEGVFGLQRAFKQAGAQTIIMSLWNVKDEATQYLMTNFYSYLMKGASKREAFTQARNKCREQYQDPASWAAFIILD
jgi:CHAT domain-containing protein